MTSPAPVCVGNIGVRERRKRARIGWVSLAIALALYGVLIWWQVDRLWRLLLFLPLWFGFLAWFEARGAT
ncbi:MAG: hypothetical protein RMJ19_10770 [Gemmatales bacterium]|nr:hypothetical protein [Gemmatales bacterium]MCS7160941.1 hypothetical protein [Gemmatales bacterium]MDW8176144.1 hypothetical protein [Gemmatales bacterium]MDW8222888.1 hypothetical protein [Gemmatales bacterium]